MWNKFIFIIYIQPPTVKIDAVVKARFLSSSGLHFDFHSYFIGAGRKFWILTAINKAWNVKQRAYENMASGSVFCLLWIWNKKSGLFIMKSIWNAAKFWVLYRVFLPGSLNATSYGVINIKAAAAALVINRHTETIFNKKATRIMSTRDFFHSQLPAAVTINFFTSGRAHNFLFTTSNFTKSATQSAKLAMISQCENVFRPPRNETDSTR